MRTRIKICGIGSVEDAIMAIEAGADALGFNCVDPPSPRTVAQALAAQLVRGLPHRVESFLLTSERTADAIVDQLRRTRTTAVQIIAHIDPAESARLAAAVPETRRVQVLHVENRDVLDLIADYAPHVDAFLLDSGKPNLAVPEFGGTGSTHDWDVSAEFVEASPLPVFLAGGLAPDNVVDAITRVKPFGVDLSTGVRTQGRLDRSKLIAFREAVRRADRI